MVCYPIIDEETENSPLIGEFPFSLADKDFLIRNLFKGIDRHTFRFEKFSNGPNIKHKICDCSFNTQNKATILPHNLCVVPVYRIVRPWYIKIKI